jgi:hypothetical protein
LLCDIALLFSYITEDDELDEEELADTSPDELKKKRKELKEEKKTGSVSAISMLPLMHRGDHQLSTVFQVRMDVLVYWYLIGIKKKKKVSCNIYLLFVERAKPFIYLLSG